MYYFWHAIFALGTETVRKDTENMRIEQRIRAPNREKELLIIQRKKIMEKKMYSKPVLEIEQFVANEYIAACFTYTADLECAFGAWHKNNHTTNVDATIASNGCVNSNNRNNPNRNLTPNNHDNLHHGAACAESVVTVTVRNDQTTIIGREGADKTYVQLTSVNIPGVDQVQSVGETFSNCTWISASDYVHFGSGVVTYFSREANAS